MVLTRPTRARRASGRRVALAAAILGLLGVSSTAGRGRAADLPRPDEAIDFLAPDGIADAHPRWTAVHRDEAAVVGDTLVWPDVSVGAVADSNPLDAHRSGRSAVGTEIAPRLLAEHDGGVHRTQVYASGDVRLYPTVRAADALEGRAGVLHDWLLRPDLTVRLQGEVDRRTDPLDTTALLTPGARRELIFETDALAAGSVQKLFDRGFVVLSGSALRATFAPPSGGGSVQRSLSDETVGVAHVRLGYLFPSSVYVFAEPAANAQALDRIARSATGERLVAGAGVGRLGLVSGEVFAGYQRETYADPATTASTPVFGGRVSYAPGQAWTFAAEVDEELGQVAVATQADPLGTPTRTQAVLGSVAYALSPLWRARVDAGATWIDYQGTARTDRLALAGLRIDYAVSRSFDLTGVVRVSALRSSLAAASYGRAAATLAAIYHY